MHLSTSPYAPYVHTRAYSCHIYFLTHTSYTSHTQYGCKRCGRCGLFLRFPYYMRARVITIYYSIITCLWTMIPSWLTPSSVTR